MSSSESDEFVNEQWDHLRQRVDVLTAAMALQGRVPSGQPLPDLNLHCLRSVDEIELQLFNLYTIPPARLAHSEDEMAMWMLEKDSLRREQVAAFLLQPNNLARMTLHRIASKIVSLDSGALFVDGLRYFLLITGLWTSFDERQAGGCSEELLRSLLSVYVYTHIQTSKKPIVPLLSQEHAGVIIEIAWLVVQCWKTLQRFEKPLASALTDFSNQLRALIKKPPSTSTTTGSANTNTITAINSSSSNNSTAANTPETFGISNKMISEIFSSISSTPMANLKPATQYPSYLFHDIKKVGKCKIGFNFKDSMSEYHVKLTKDALYVFSHPELSSGQVVAEKGKRHELLACISLQNVQPQRISFSDNEQVIELLDIEGRLASWLEYDVASYKFEEQDYHFSAPKDIHFHDRVLLDFSSTISNTNNQSYIIEEWIDLLESTAWDCRNGQQSVFNNV